MNGLYRPLLDCYAVCTQMKPAKTHTEPYNDNLRSFFRWQEFASQNLPEAEFLDIIGTKVLWVFFLAINSQLYTNGFYPPPPPPCKSGLKLVCNVNIVYGNLNIMPRNLNEIVHSWIRLLEKWQHVRMYCIGGEKHTEEVHCKKCELFFRRQPGWLLPNSPRSGIIKEIPARESLVSDIPAGDGKTAHLFDSVHDTCSPIELLRVCRLLGTNTHAVGFLISLHVFSGVWREWEAAKSYKPFSLGKKKQRGKGSFSLFSSQHMHCLAFETNFFVF
jgi:hypothetical protein